MWIVVRGLWGVFGVVGVVRFDRITSYDRTFHAYSLVSLGKSRCFALMKGLVYSVIGSMRRGGDVGWQSNVR